MARFRNKKRKPFVKPIVRKQPTVDHVTGDKIPKSFVFCRGKLPGPLRQLEMDLRKLMLPYTALKLKMLFVYGVQVHCSSAPFRSFIYDVLQEKKRNNIKDFLNVAGPMGVTHFLILSKTETAPYLRVARTPQGPTITFKIHEYSLATDIARSQLRPRSPKDLFKTPPLIVLSGFGTGEQHLKLTTIMFQNIFPAIDINTVKVSSCQRIVLLNYNKDTKLIDFRHYSIRLQPVGVSRRIRKFVQNHQVPDLRNLKDVSDFVTKAGYGSESEMDDEAATVSLPMDLDRVNQASNQSAVKLQEIGPRMTLQLMKIEEGLCTGGVIFSESGYNTLSNNQKTVAEDQKHDNNDEDEDV
ncbi:PETER PAN-like protein [Striga asiatica]|uniref:PETER PAN-like protein n=1 Tax=Striga asiatica TaxID=4170 RepID=A0A5A7NW60_STRAF|nr:PETER PAN-like protein [Striga asiatica]